jgi:hypothetical protein
MAKKLAGHIFFIGRMDPIQVYMSCGKCIVRSVSSLTGKRVKTDPAFRQTMQHAAILGRASRIGSFVYGELPKDFRQFWMYRAFTGEAIQLLREGKTDEEAKAILWKTYAAVWVAKTTRPTTTCRHTTKTIMTLPSIVLLPGSSKAASQSLFNNYLLSGRRIHGKKTKFSVSLCPSLFSG